jgi:hypothetical protein
MSHGAAGGMRQSVDRGCAPAMGRQLLKLKTELLKEEEEVRNPNSIR